ncbi:prevent-host-death family protein [Skermanella aerolata]|jgi:prevent-host-death family protein|uniref:Antitoxin n=1 Tax=Skermanella aerolata TaxID=393310 RepID=A0A512DWB5_9PROT|nr:type II toxin-antitoxin system prevent-host-death family antitoxin [Skermanella aerolata]GEO40751.1 antitoxin [Skermanella aerolata]
MSTMTSIGAFEAKTHFASLLERVAQGEQITITRHGTPVAKIVPIGGPDRNLIEHAIARIKEFGKGQTLGGLSVRELRDEGRR